MPNTPRATRQPNTRRHRLPSCPLKVLRLLPNRQLERSLLTSAWGATGSTGWCSPQIAQSRTAWTGSAGTAPAAAAGAPLLPAGRREGRGGGDAQFWAGQNLLVVGRGRQVPATAGFEQPRLQALIGYTMAPATHRSCWSGALAARLVLEEVAR